MRVNSWNPNIEIGFSNDIRGTYVQNTYKIHSPVAPFLNLPPAEYNIRKNNTKNITTVRDAGDAISYSLRSVNGYRCTYYFIINIDLNILILRYWLLLLGLSNDVYVYTRDKTRGKTQSY